MIKNFKIFLESILYRGYTSYTKPSNYTWLSYDEDLSRKYSEINSAIYGGKPILKKYSIDVSEYDIIDLSMYDVDEEMSEYDLNNFLNDVNVDYDYDDLFDITEDVIPLSRLINKIIPKIVKDEDGFIILENGKKTLLLKTKLLIFNESFTYEVSEEERDSISKNISFGFTNKDEAREELDWLLDNDYPRGYKNIPDQIHLYRLLFLGEIDFDADDMVRYSESQKLNTKKLGYHWFMFPRTIDKGFIDAIRSTSDAPNVDPTIIKGLFNSEDLDWESTINHNMNFPQEQEISTKTEPISFEVFTLEEFKNKHGMNDW